MVRVVAQAFGGLFDEPMLGKTEKDGFNGLKEVMDYFSIEVGKTGFNFNSKITVTGIKKQSEADFFKSMFEVKK